MDHEHERRRARRFLYAGAVAVGVTVGAAGIAGAVTSRPNHHATASTEAADGPEDTAGEAAEERAYTDAHRRTVAVSQAQAEAAALAAKPGRVFDAHLQTEDGQMVWEVKTDDGSSVWEIQIDPQNGSVVHLQLDD